MCPLGFSQTIYLPACSATSQPRTLELYRLLGVLDDILKRARFAQPIVHYKLPGGTEVAREFHMFPWMNPTPDCPYVSTLSDAQIEACIY